MSEELSIHEILEGVKKGRYTIRQVGTSVYEVYKADSDELIGYVECPEDAQSPEDCEFKPVEERRS